MAMISVHVEGVRRNFTSSSVFLYSVFLVDDTGRRLLVLGVERHEALPIVAVLNNIILPRQDTINLMAETLRLLNYTLEEVRIERYSMLPPLYNLCGCRLRWRKGEDVQEQVMHLRPGDVVGLALLMNASFLLSDDVFQQMGTELPEGQPLELVLARYMLKREGITLPEGKEPRLGYSKTPLRDALVKEVQGFPFRKSADLPRRGYGAAQKGVSDLLAWRECLFLNLS
ncbi:bifunctional nuclease domain-containing protein [Dictyobacter formicarum]|uniref:BFN domain-containing protein n=1 Tax=Dictyobacter formicarum TaxID=2778368 RepID=A0ABQ3VJ52_9CHLR|nr:bifunctional nuclease domain-containing protein [Dictyobacter formicarum]GHO85156.1 hypothetical protein KSZ_31620 [Dictyobacter formicarum]